MNKKKLKSTKIKNILVTGGSGLLARHILKSLIRNNHKVISLDKKKNYYKYSKLKFKNHQIIFGNFQSKKLICNIIKKYNINVIFHLGASTQVLNALTNPENTYKNNIMGTINILEAIRLLNPKIILIYASSDKAYGEKNINNYKEKDKLHSIFPYDVSKSASDLICQSYSKTYSLSVGILRCTNLYGPGDFNLKRIIPETIIKSIKKEKLTIRSNGKLTRDYLFVEDAVKAYILVMKSLLKSKKNKLLIYNVSSKFNSNVINLVKNIQLKINNSLDYLIKNTSKMENRNQKLNFTKIQKELNWKPITNLDNGLNKTIEWYKSNISKFK